jgi:hypothetical protein
VAAKRIVRVPQPRYLLAINLKNAVDGVVGVNLFAKTMDYVRINSHLQIQFNMLNKNNFFIQLRFLGSRVRHLQGGAANRGRLLFGYFFLATQKKVSSCRSATGNGKKWIWIPHSI